MLARHLFPLTPRLEAGDVGEPGNSGSPKPARENLSVPHLWVNISAINGQQFHLNSGTITFFSALYVSALSPTLVYKKSSPF